MASSPSNVKFQPTIEDEAEVAALLLGRQNTFSSQEAQLVNSEPETLLAGRWADGPATPPSGNDGEPVRLGASLAERRCEKPEGGGSIPPLRATFTGVAQLAERRVNNPPVQTATEEKREAQEGCKPNALRSQTGVTAKHGCDNIAEVGGSNPSPRPISKIQRFQVRWREPLGEPECPYAYRWTVNLWLFSVRVHQWIRSDDKRFFHDHPWHFFTLCLRGGYTDVSPAGRDTLRAGSLRFRRAEYRHYVEVPATGALTVLLTSMPVRNWGFWVKGQFKRPLRYFGKFGHPPCHEQ